MDDRIGLFLLLQAYDTVIVTVISRFLKRCSKAKSTRAPAYSRALSLFTSAELTSLPPLFRVKRRSSTHPN